MAYTRNKRIRPLFEVDAAWRNERLHYGSYEHWEGSQGFAVWNAAASGPLPDLFPTNEVGGAVLTLDA